MTSPDRWRDVQRILDGALDLPPEARDTYVTDACGADHSLRAEVTALLTACTEAEEAAAVFASHATAFAAPMLSELAAQDAERRRTMAATLGAALAGRYTIDRVLAQGGMATVLLGHDLRHERAVAIKVLARDLVAPAGAERFLREIRVTARLTHPHLLPMHDSGEAEGLLYYVMPYVEGETLRARLAQGGPLPLPDALRLLRELADALAFAHGGGVVHCDLKPENILLAGGHAVVADFGIAKALAAAADPSPLGMPSAPEISTVLGTPAYMAPEQADGHTPVDHRADLYALGVVAWELLAGVHPFGARTPEAMVAAHRTETPVPLGEVRREVPPTLATLVARLLAKEPADRPRDATEVLRILETISPSAQHRFRRLRLAGIATGLVLLLVAASMMTQWWTRSGVTAVPTSIAVLPFQNLTSEEQYAYFAAGLHDELLTQLSQVPGLSLRGRASVMGYAGTTKSVRQLGVELHVGALVHASVQVVGGRLRFNVQLVDVATDQNLWAERYDRTLDDAFTIQSEVAQQVATAVGATLVRSEQRSTTEPPTTSPEAYRLYLQGRTYDTRPGFVGRNWEIAQQLYERAIALDSGFALAHAALSQIHGRMYWFRYDSSPERAEAQQREAEAALRLAPDLPQAHLAEGLVQYFARRNFRGALDAFAIAQEGLPNDPEVMAFIGFARRRLGNRDDALVAFNRALAFDPRNADLWTELGGTLLTLRRYTEAVRAFDQALSLAPDHYGAAANRAQAFTRWQGTDTLRAVLSRLPRDAQLGGCGSTLSLHAFLLHWERHADSLLSLVSNAPLAAFNGESCFMPPALHAAWAHQLRGDRPAARAAFADALVVLDSAMKTLPEDWRVHSARGLALAGLGRREDALREADWLRTFPDEYLQVILLRPYRAQILAQLGLADSALDEIEGLLAVPSTLTAHVLQSDPLWDPIRTHPRFRELVARYRSH